MERRWSVWSNCCRPQMQSSWTPSSRRAVLEVSNDSERPSTRMSYRKNWSRYSVGETVKRRTRHGGRLQCGPLIGSQTIIEHYTSLAGSASHGSGTHPWVPIVHEGWYQAGIEMDTPERGLIIEGSFPEMPFPVGPSLTAVMHATCDIFEASFTEPPRDSGPGSEYQRWCKQRDEIVARRYRHYGEVPTSEPFFPED